MRVRQVKGRKQYRDFQTGEMIEVGETHYTWQPYRCPMRRSKLFPQRSAMTQSPTLSSLYDVEDQLARIENVDEVERIIEALEEIASDCEEQAENVSQYFGDSPTVETLRDRAYGLEDAIDELRALQDDPDTELDAFHGVSIT